MGVWPLSLPVLLSFRIAAVCGGGLKYSRGFSGGNGASEVGQDVTVLSSSSLLAKERQREHFPKEWRAETLDNSRCFPGAYRGRGPSGFVSCGCSCLWAKWTTVDLTLDLSSLPLCLLLVLLSLSLLTLSCSFILLLQICCQFCFPKCSKREWVLIFFEIMFLTICAITTKPNWPYMKM